MFRKQVIDSNSLFDEQVFVKRQMSQCCTEDSWQKASIEQKWVQMFKKFEEKNTHILNFQKPVEFIFCSPGTSAPVDRSFSTMNRMWSDNRSKMLEKNVKALITCRSNTDFSCCDFYEKIISNKDFLKKVLCTEHYDWGNVQIYKWLSIFSSFSKTHYFSFSWFLNYRNQNSYILQERCELHHLIKLVVLKRFCF